VPGDTAEDDDEDIFGEADELNALKVGASPVLGGAAGGVGAVVVGEVAEELAAFRADYAPNLAEDLFFFTRILGGR
jgi:hypothetical protein